MDFLTVTPADRLTAAHEHFSSSGMNIQKVLVLLALAGFIAFLVYYAKKDKDVDKTNNDENDE
ncbi:MAG: hypothetical protein AB7E76_06260 [Deferribacterales bacterium]|jgi:CRISPR/Cas system-associated protein Csx1